MIGKFKERNLKKLIRSEMRRDILNLGRPGNYKTILFVSEKESESFKKTINKFFPKAHIHHLHLRALKTDATAGHNYSVHESDFKLTGKLKNDKLIHLCHTTFDLVLDLSENNLFLNCILHEIKAKLIVGKINAGNSDLHDLFIDGGQNNVEFLENFMNQIKILTNNGN